MQSPELTSILDRLSCLSEEPVTVYGPALYGSLRIAAPSFAFNWSLAEASHPDDLLAEIQLVQGAFVDGLARGAGLTSDPDVYDVHAFAARCDDEHTFKKSHAFSIGCVRGRALSNHAKARLAAEVL